MSVSDIFNKICWITNGYLDMHFIYSDDVKENFHFYALAKIWYGLIVIIF